MPTIRLSKIKVRRGTDSQRRQTVFDQGELVHTIDTGRLFVGTGTLSGGIAAGNKIHKITSYYSLSTLNAEVGDMARLGTILYQLVDPDYTNIANWESLEISLTIAANSISASHISPNSFSNGLSSTASTVRLNFNTTQFALSNDNLIIKPEGISQAEIDDATTFNATIVRSNSNLFGVASSFFQTGFDVTSYPTELYTTVAGLGDTSMWLDGRLLKSTTDNGGLSSVILLPKISSDRYGRVQSLEPAIYSTLMSISDINGADVTVNGFPNQTLSALSSFSYKPTAFNPYTVTVAVSTLTAFAVNESPGSEGDLLVVTLSAAGFITFEGGFSSRTGQPIARFAIPIYNY